MTKKSGRAYTSKHGWREIDGRKIYFRSDWEFKYACFLQLLKDRGSIKDWEHEPKTFWFDEIKCGTRSYLPDFRVNEMDGRQYWVEVKGYMDAKSKTKIKRFGKYYPSEQLMVVTGKWFKENEALIRGIYGKEEKKVREENEKGDGGVQRGRTPQRQQIRPESDKPQAGDRNRNVGS